MGVLLEVWTAGLGALWVLGEASCVLYGHINLNMIHPFAVRGSVKFGSPCASRVQCLLCVYNRDLGWMCSNCFI